jgi:hypothetical protein
VEVFDPVSTRVCLSPLKRDLGGLDKNTFYFDTTAASLFVTGETVVKVFIPVVTVYYLRVAALNVFNCLSRCLATDVCSDSNIQAFRQHATLLTP